MHRATRRFWKCLDDLPEPVQRTAKKNFELLKRNPSHPSLHFKKVGKFWSARAGISYRALAVEDGDDFIVKNDDVLAQVQQVGDPVRVERLNERNQWELSRLGFEDDVRKT